MKVVRSAVEFYYHCIDLVLRNSPQITCQCPGNLVLLDEVYYLDCSQNCCFLLTTWQSLFPTNQFVISFLKGKKKKRLREQRDCKNGISNSKTVSIIVLVHPLAVEGGGFATVTGAQALGCRDCYIKRSWWFRPLPVITVTAVCFLTVFFPVTAAMSSVESNSSKSQIRQALHCSTGKRILCSPRRRGCYYRHLLPCMCKTSLEELWRNIGLLNLSMSANITSNTVA